LKELSSEAPDSSMRSTFQFLTGQWTVVEKKYARFEKAPPPIIPSLPISQSPSNSSTPTPVTPVPRSVESPDSLMSSTGTPDGRNRVNLLKTGSKKEKKKMDIFSCI
jgi:hypothetical protein